jgi:hypothetical protein
MMSLECNDEKSDVNDKNYFFGRIYSVKVQRIVDFRMQI